MQKTSWTNFSTLLLWSGLEKGFTYECTLRGSQQPFSCVFSHQWRTNTRTPNRVIQGQTCSRPVRRQSFAIIDQDNQYHFDRFFRTQMCWPKMSPLLSAGEDLRRSNFTTAKDQTLSLSDPMMMMMMMMARYISDMRFVYVLSVTLSNVHIYVCWRIPALFRKLPSNPKQIGLSAR